MAIEHLIVLGEGVQRIRGVEATQVRLGLTAVGFTTAFESVVLSWSAAGEGPQRP